MQHKQKLFAGMAAFILFFNCSSDDVDEAAKPFLDTTRSAYQTTMAQASGAIKDSGEFNPSKEALSQGELNQIQAIWRAAAKTIHAEADEGKKLFMSNNGSNFSPEEVETLFRHTININAAYNHAIVAVAGIRFADEAKRQQFIKANSQPAPKREDFLEIHQKAYLKAKPKN